MTTSSWTSRLPVAEYRAPTTRVYVSRVVASPEGDEPRPADWLAELYARYWQPVELSWAAGGRPSTLRLRRVLGVGADKPDRGRAEEDAFLAGDRVRLVTAHGGGPRGTALTEWFRGYVAQERLLIQAPPAGETQEVGAYGPELLLAGKVVSGQWHAAPETDEALTGGTFSPGQLVRDGAFRSHLPVIFNERGRPNASPGEVAGNDAQWRLDSGAEAATAAGRAFEAPGRRVLTDAARYEAQMWRAGPAVQSLIEVVDDYAVISPESMAMFPAELFDRTIGEVNVEGMGLLEALRAVLRPIGYGFCTEPWARQDGRHVLRVFALHGSTEGSRVLRPYMAPIHGGDVHISDRQGRQAEVQRIEYVRDNHNVANDVAVVGDQKRKQVTLTFSAGGSELRPAWDTSVHDLADWASGDVIDPMQWPAEGSAGLTVEYFDEHYAYGAQGHADCRHVFRSFAWNEDAALNDVIGGPGDAASFGAGSGGHYIRRPRPLGPTFLRDEADAMVRNFPAFVQLGVDGDDASWIQVPAVIWTDRAGLTIPVNPLSGWYPYADEYSRHATSQSESETLFATYGMCSYLTLLHNALRNGGTHKLRLRVIGSVECDEAVTGRAARRAARSWPFPAAKPLRAGPRVRDREVPDGSDPFELAPGRHDTRDDSADAADYAESVRDVMEDEVGHGSIVLRHVTRAYAPGDVIPATQGRVIDLTVRTGERTHAPVVVGVNWDLRPGRNKTELVLDTPLLGVMQ